MVLAHSRCSRPPPLLRAPARLSHPLSNPRTSEILTRQTNLASPLSFPPQSLFDAQHPGVPFSLHRPDCLYTFSVFEPHSLWQHLWAAPPAAHQSTVSRSSQATLTCSNPFLAPPHLQDQVQAPWDGGLRVLLELVSLTLPFSLMPQQATWTCAHLHDSSWSDSHNLSVSASFGGCVTLGTVCEPQFPHLKNEATRLSS